MKWNETEEQPSITCPKCGMKSYNPNDIREGYCGNCHDWTQKKHINVHLAALDDRFFGVRRFRR